MRYFIVILFALLHQNEIFAESDVKLSGMFIANDYRYAEYDEDGNKLIEESGVIYGQGLHIEFPLQLFNRPFSMAAHYRYFDDKTPYNGQTQFGFPLRTTTQHEIEEVAISLHIPVHRHITLYASVHANQRKRDIQATSFTTGLYEEYDWLEVSSGFQTFLGSKRQWKIRGEFFQVINPKILIDSPTSTDGTYRLKLGEKPGFDLSLSYIKTFENWQLINSIGMRYQAFGVSNKLSVQREPTNVTIHQPESIALSRTITSSLSYLW